MNSKVLSADTFKQTILDIELDYFRKYFDEGIRVVQAEILITFPKIDRMCNKKIPKEEDK